MGITGVKTVGPWDLDAERPGERDVQLAHLHRLSSWMLILGTVRLLCMLGDYARSYAEISRGVLFSLSAVSRFVQSNPPGVLVGFAWPLMLGLILRRTRLWIFLPAAAVTFFILSLGGWLALVAGFWMTADSHIAFGSFEVFRGNLFQFRPGAMFKAIMGITQLVLELGAAVSAWNLARRMRSTVSPQMASSGSGAMASASGADKPEGGPALTSKKHCRAAWRFTSRLLLWCSMYVSPYGRLTSRCSTGLASCASSCSRTIRPTTAPTGNSARHAPRF